jgi:hypothetical protein
MDTNLQITCIAGPDLATHLVQGFLSNGYTQIPKPGKPQPYYSVVPRKWKLQFRLSERERERMFGVQWELNRLQQFYAVYKTHCKDNFKNEFY